MVRRVSSGSTAGVGSAEAPGFVLRFDAAEWLPKVTAPTPAGWIEGLYPWPPLEAYRLCREARVRWLTAEGWMDDGRLTPEARERLRAARLDRMAGNG